MTLLTNEIRHTLPRLYKTKNTPLKDKVAVAKFFNPCGSWTWFAVEGEATEEGDFEFWGLVQGHEAEWGYFRLSELTAFRGQLGLPLERDLYFTPTRMGDLFPELEAEGDG
jgi:hypothetical protein